MKFQYTKTLLVPARALLSLAFIAVMGASAVGQTATVVTSYDATGTWLCPAGVTSITVECWGGGGRGGTRTTNGRGGGGGGGAYSSSVLAVSPGTTYTVTVGGGSTTVAAGGDSWFNTAATILAKGGNSAADNSTVGATGGAAGSGIGTTTLSGGNGAAAPAGSGGGGGSSAGTAANGNNATTITGAVAPTGGGNGGDGGNSTIGGVNGSAGVEPGGAGGGGERVGGFGTGTGGAGANGKVTITWGSYANGNCLATNQAPIYDFACGHAVTSFTFAVSGLPTTLGTAPGQVTLDNVALIISGTFNADLEVTLTSPGGATRNLMLDRFGSGDNIGVPGTCPASPLVLRDGGLALVNTNTNNVTGTYAPEQTLGGFTGNPNGNWVLRICDDEDADFHQARLVRLKFCTRADAGANANVCETGGALAANTPPTGTGSWSVVSGPSLLLSQFSNVNSPTATFTPAGGAGAYTLRWTITDSPCAVNTDDVVITAIASPTTATVGGAQTICENGTSTGLGGNTPVVGTGAWSIIGGGTGTFTPNASDPIATFTHTGGTVTAVRWTISNTPCTASTADVSITITPAPTTATVGGPQTICENATTVGLGGNTPGSGTGAWSIVSGGTGTFNPDNLAANATFTHAAGSGPVVVRWTISTAAPCTPSTADVSITISQEPTASAAGGDQSVCSQPGTATMAANTPTDGTGAWTQVSGPAATIVTPGSPTTTITGMTTPGSYVFKWTISNAPCTATEDEVTVTTAVCTYYSRASGNVNAPIWSDTPGGIAGAATFTSATSMVVQDPDVVTNTTNTQVDDLTIEAGAPNGQLVLTAGTIFTVNGDAMVVNGTLTANDNSIMLLSPAVASTASFASTTSFWDLALDAAVSCTVTGNIEIRGSLDLFDGIFDCSANQVTLRSTATYTGRLGPVDPGASYVGNMKVQRRIPAGATNWRLLGSPIAGRVVEDWDDDFITAGYPGSDYPNFDDPVGSGISWPSVRYYDETEASAVDSVGLHGVANTNVSLAQGQGFAVWCGDNLGGTAAFMIDVQDGAPHIANTPITLPMSWTNVPTSADGWNLVSNPLPSPIDFETMSLGADVDEVVTFYNPANGNSATYDRVSNLSNNDGTNVIQSSQGFFLKANGPAVTTTVSESDKINTNTGGIFGLGGEVPAHLRLSISSDVNTFSDESVVYFTAGTPDLDERDALKYVFAHSAAPQIATLASGEQIAINAYGSIDGAISIPLRVNVGVTGTYVISGVEVGGLELNCLSIEDLEMGTIASLEDGAAYSFNMTANADPSVPRFVLHANNGPQASFTADNTTVIVGQAVQFTATTTTGNYSWEFGDGAQSTEQNPSHAYTTAGTYQVVLTVDDGLCSSTASMDVTVELSTGITNTENTATHVWANRDWIFVDHNYQGSEPLFIEVLDATGRLQAQRKVAASPGRVTLPADEMSTGVWFVRLTQGDTQKTFRVPLIR